jgi:hypothetical protein
VIIADDGAGFNIRGEKPVGGGVKRAESPTLRVAGGKRYKRGRGGTRGGLRGTKSPFSILKLKI